MRLFIGIPLAAETRAQLEALIARLRSPGDGLRWTQPESWHITLQFLGETGLEQMECVRGRLAEVRAAAVCVEMEEPGCFERAGVFHVGVRATADLEALERQVTAATAGCGFVAEKRPFRPHITLARVRERGRTEPLRALRARIGAPVAIAGFTAREFLLYESFLEPRGARYEVRARFGLGEA